MCAKPTVLLHRNVVPLPCATAAAVSSQKTVKRLTGGSSTDRTDGLAGEMLENRNMNKWKHKNQTCKVRDYFKNRTFFEHCSLYVWAFTLKLSKTMVSGGYGHSPHNMQSSENSPAMSSKDGRKRDLRVSRQPQCNNFAFQ